MNKKVKNIIQKQTQLKIQRNLYLISSIFFLTTIIINILSIFYYPYILNGLILEANIAIITLFIYLTIKKQKKVLELEDQKLELKIKYILKNS